MEDITFCVPYYGKAEQHTFLLERCISCIRMHYPTNTILICKTSDSYMPDIGDDTNIHIYNTFVDGSHVIGAIELIIRECKTNHFLICHDSMFLLKPLPTSVLDKELLPLWHFETYRDNYDIISYVKEDSSVNKDSDVMLLSEMYNTQFGKKWYGLFGPAFLGKTHTIRGLWSLLNINSSNIHKYLGRRGLMECERYFPILFVYMNIDTKVSLNGDIFKHPNAFHQNTLPPIHTIQYDSYFFKVWQGR
jgi:hypothetical protein